MYPSWSKQISTHLLGTAWSSSAMTQRCGKPQLLRSKRGGGNEAIRFHPWAIGGKLKNVPNHQSAVVMFHNCSIRFSWRRGASKSIATRCPGTLAEAFNNPFGCRWSVWVALRFKGHWYVYGLRYTLQSLNKNLCQSWLVGGWPTPLKNMKVSWDDDIANISG